MRTLLIFISLISTTMVNAQDSTFYLHTPSWAGKVVRNSELAKGYEFLRDVNPFYFEEDFTGDGVQDIAFLVKEKLSGKRGVFIVNGGKNVSFVLGAGKDIGMGTDISWSERWFVYRDEWIYNFNDKKKKFRIEYPGVEVVKSETTSVVIYWSGRAYKTYIKHI